MNTPSPESEQLMVCGASFGLFTLVKVKIGASPRKAGGEGPAFRAGRREIDRAGIALRGQAHGHVRDTCAPSSAASCPDWS